jgi:hypothetical protein
VEWVSDGEVIYKEDWAEASTTDWGKVSFNIDDHSQATFEKNVSDLTISRLMVLLSPRAGLRNCQKHSWLSKPVDMTIHWKALGKHFPMVPLVVRFSFRGINAFSVYFPHETSVLKELTLWN